MIKDKLKKESIHIYQTLKKALMNNQVSHAYLLAGKNDILKEDVALLLAKSIIENNNDYACETCITCQRIENKSYLDLIYIDGSDESIKKEAIVDLQNQFVTKASENAGKKIYIINNIENTSIAALNSLLKFLEEPNGQTYAILITKNLNKVLDTIKSRCQILTIKTGKVAEVEKKYLDLGFSGFQASFLAHNLNYVDERLINDDIFLLAYDYLIKMLTNYPNELDSFLYDVINEVCTNTDKDMELKFLNYLIKMYMHFIKDFIVPFNIDESWYNKECNKLLSINNYDKILLQCLETLDRLNKIYDYRLLIEKLIYEIKENSRDGG